MDTSLEAQWRQKLPPQLKPAPIELLLVSVLMALAGAFLLVVVLTELPDVFRSFGAGKFGRWIADLLLMVCVALAAIGVPCLLLAWRIAHADRVARGLSYVLLGSLGAALLISNDHRGWLTLALVACLASIAILAWSPNVRTYFLERGSDGDEPTPVAIARTLVTWWAAVVLILGVLCLLLADLSGKFLAAGLIFGGVAVTALAFNKRLAAGDPVARQVVTILPLGLVVAGFIFGSRSLAVMEPIAISVGLACFLWLPADSRGYFDAAAAAAATATAHGRSAYLTPPPATPAAWACPNCAAAVEPGWQHCSACGLAVDAVATPTAPTPQPATAPESMPQGTSSSVPTAPHVVPPPPPRPEPAAAPLPEPLPALPWRLVLDSGDALDVDGLVLIGANPAAAAGESPDHLVIVDDDAGSVAPTHLACGLAADGFWVADRGSASGLFVERGPGQRQRCTPGGRTLVAAGAKVYFGDRWFLAPGAPQTPQVGQQVSRSAPSDELDDLERTRRRPSMPG